LAEQIEQEPDFEFDFMQFLNELKYYIYIISWLVKLYFNARLSEMKEMKVINNKVVKYIGF
jgi:hypothetical protein